MSSVVSTLQSQTEELRKQQQLKQQRIGELEAALEQAKKKLETQQAKTAEAGEEEAAVEAEEKALEEAYQAMLSEIRAAFQ